MDFELKNVHIDYLKHIKRLRLRFLLKIYGGLLLLPLSIMVLYLINGEHILDSLGIIIITSPFFMIVAIAIYLPFAKKMYLTSKDIRHKSGEKIKRQIIVKRYFPITNDYFFLFAEVKIPNIKIDSLTFSHYQEGDYFTVSIAKYSKIVFEDYERFDLV